MVYPSIEQREEYHLYDDILKSKSWRGVDCVMVESDHPLCAVYQPGFEKAMVRTTGDFAIGMNYSAKNVFNFQAGSVNLAFEQVHSTKG